MKKSLIILVVITSFFTFQTALKKYDLLLDSRFRQFTQTEQQFRFAISKSEQEIQLDKLQADLVFLLDKYKINAYQMVASSNDNGDEEIIVWAHTSDQDYLNNIFLTEGRLTKLKQGDYYFSNDSGEQGLIFNPIRLENYKLYYLTDFNNNHKSIFTPYTLVSYDANAEMIFNDFVAEFTNLYPDLFISSGLMDFHLEVEALDYETIIFALLMGLMVILGLNVLLIKQTKKIQILKLEGCSNVKIYKQYILPYLGLVLIVQTVVHSFLYFYYMNTSFANTKPFLVFLSAPVLIFITSLIVFSLFTFITISLITINTAIKGKSKLKRQKYWSYVLKGLLIVATTTIVFEGVGYLKQSYQVATTESEYLENIKYLYNSTYIRPEYEGKSDGDEVGQSAIKEYLIKENQMFDIGTQLDSETIRGEVFVAEVSQEYVKNYLPSVISDRMLPNKNYVLLPKHLETKQEDIKRSLNEAFIYSGFNSINDVLFYEEKVVEPLVPYIYLQQGNKLQNVVFFVTPNDGLSNTSYFTYEGNASEAQKYYEDVAEMYNAVPYLNIESVSEQYNVLKAHFIQKAIVMLPLFFMIILALFVSTYQLAILNVAINQKKYSLLKCEGEQVFKLILEEIKICALLLLLAETILYRFLSLQLTDLIWLIAVYLVVDIIVLWGVTKVKMRYFVENLR